MDEPEPLKAARPDADEGRAEYLPRLPWKWIALIAAVLVLGGGAYMRDQRQKAAALRGRILGRHASFAPLATRYQTFRDKLEGWTLEAAKTAPTTFAEPRFKLARLRNGQGVYLRLRAEDATSKEAIARGARRMVADAITRCMGLGPVSARGLYEQGGILEPSYVAEARETNDVMRLRVLEDQIERRGKVDVPAISTLVSSRWFLLVLERGESRAEGPVDVFIWDIPSGRSLLRARTVPDGILVSARIAIGEGGPRARLPSSNSAGAVDCSIAAQVKEATGEPMVDFASEIPDRPATATSAGTATGTGTAMGTGPATGTGTGPATGPAPAAGTPIPP